MNARSCWGRAGTFALYQDFVHLFHIFQQTLFRFTAQVIQDYIEGRTPLVNMMTPAQLNETVLFDERTYVLDVRPLHDREKHKGLPKSHYDDFDLRSKECYASLGLSETSPPFSGTKESP